jgi:serine/threonine-protein kinase
MIERLGKYQIETQIGRGGMGAVYRARDPLLKRLVALKVISENVDMSDELRARFFREAQACAQLSHPNIITIYDLGEEEGRLFIVMEYLEGEELKQIITRRRDLPLETKLALMMQICDGLAYAHEKGIVHRDIKPGNVFVLTSGTAKVLDFGVARLVSATDDLTRAGLLMGTLRYMPPEQAQGRVDQRSDMFSAGVVFYELMTHRTPLTADDPMAILGELHSTVAPSVFRPDPAIPEDLGAVLERALRKNPDERFRDMTEMRDALAVVRARLAEEATALRRRLEARAAEARELHGELVEQVGGQVAPDALTAPADRAPVAALEAALRDSEEQLARLRKRIVQARALRPEYERARARMRLGQWDEAAEALEAIVGQMPEHGGAQEELARARAEILRAAEVLRREREACEHAQQLMEELRRRGAPAAAVEDQEGPWSSAEASRAAGLSALNDQSFAAARELFDTAAEQYRTAAEALDRRVQQLLGDARRRLERRQFADCLPLVNEVLALIPDQPEATALHLDAQKGAREEAERRAAFEQRCDSARRELATGRFQEAIATLTALVEEDSDHARARQLLADARAGLAEEEARGQRLLAEAEARARLLAEQQARQAEEEARVRLTEAEARMRLAEEEARAAAAVLEREPPDPSSLDQTVPVHDRDVTVIAPPGPGESGRSRSTRMAIGSPMAEEVVEPPAAEVGVPVPERAPQPPDAAGVEPRRQRRIWGRPLLLASGGVLVIGAAVVIWMILASAGVQREVEQARQGLAAARGGALNARASEFAPDLFAAADAKRSEGEQLALARSFGAALVALREATSRYGEAERVSEERAKEERAKADEARASMLAEKGRAASEAKEFKEGLAHETDGDAQYAKQAFRDAAESFRAAERLFTKARLPTLPLPPPAPTPDDEIRETLRLYVRAFETKDPVLLQQVWPGILPEELSRIRAVFEQARSIRVTLRVVGPIRVNGSDAEATGRRVVVLEMPDKDTVRNAEALRFRFKRSNNRWTIAWVVR